MKKKKKKYIYETIISALKNYQLINNNFSQYIQTQSFQDQHNVHSYCLQAIEQDLYVMFETQVDD